MPINLDFLDTFDVFKWSREEKKATQQESVTPPPLGTANPNDTPDYMELSKNSTFTGDKTDVAIAVKAKGNDPIIPGSTRTLPSGETVSLTEIDDSESTIIRGNKFIKYLTDNEFRDYATEEGTNTAWTYSSVADVLKHDKLYNARPEYKNIPVEVKRRSDRKTENGVDSWASFRYHPLNNKLDKIIIYAEDSKGKQITKSEDALRRTLLHELQHKGEFDIEYYNKNGIAVSNSYSSDHNLQVSTEDRANMTEEERQKNPMDMSWLPQTIKDETVYDSERKEWVTVTGGKEIDDMTIYTEFLKEKEGKRLKAYKPQDKEEYYTIGYGHYDKNITKDMVITDEQAEKYLRKDINDRLVAIRKAIPKFDSLPIKVRTHLLGSWFRGSLSGSPKTIRLINEGKFEEASKEFLNNNEYKTTKLTGVKDRMDATAQAIASLS